VYRLNEALSNDAACCNDLKLDRGEIDRELNVLEGGAHFAERASTYKKELRLQDAN
jgi:hypothetical protein